MLKPKVLIDFYKKLLAKYYNYLNIFSYMLVKRQLLFCLSIDYKIPLEKTFNK